MCEVISVCDRCEKYGSECGWRSSRPQMPRTGELVEDRAIAVLDVRADDQVRRRVDEIPVVDVLRHVLQVCLVDPLANGRRAARILIDEDKQRDDALFVQRRTQQGAHLHERRCPAGRCPALIQYHVKDNCIGCTLCAQVCPVGAIEFRPYERHQIDTGLCTCCDMCFRACQDDAIEVIQGARCRPSS